MNKPTAKFTLIYDPMMDEETEHVDAISREDWKCLVTGIYIHIKDNVNQSMFYHKMAINNITAPIYLN